MADIISTATVTEIKAVEASAVVAVAASETGVLAFVKAHYTKVAFAAIGAAIVLVWKIL